MQDVVQFEQGIVLKLTMPRNPLIKQVNHVMKAVSSQTATPILTGIKLTAADDQIVLTGSNADFSIESTIPLDDEEGDITIAKPGSIVIPGQFFSDLIKKLPEEYVEIKVDERHTATISSGNAEFNLNGLDPEEYPRLPKIEQSARFSIPTDTLKALIRQTAFAVSTSESQPVLTGVHWEIKDGVLTCVATDGHRLALRNVGMAEHPEDEVDFVIPGKSLTEFAKVLDEGAESLSFTVAENQVLFEAGNIKFFSRLLKDSYPDTKRLIPAESKTHMIVETKTLLQALERTWLLAREARNHVVKLGVSYQQGIEISSHSSELGKVFDKMDARSVEGEEVKISFSAKFMISALRAIDAEEVDIRFTGAMRPVVVQPVEDDNILQLVLPVRSF